jgi:hypothetical protein
MSDRSSDSPDQEPSSDSLATDEVRDKRPDTVAQYVPEQLTRRQAVVGAAVLTVSVVAISSNGDETKSFDRAKTQFSDLATTIDESDLRNPRQTTKLKATVSETLENVASSLGPVADRGGNKTETTETDTRGASAGTSSQSTDVREELTRAQAYYADLESVLARAVLVHESLRALEPILLYNTDRSASELLDDVPIKSLDSAIESRFPANQLYSRESTTHSPELYPDRAAVNSQLQDLARIYDRLVVVQRGIFDSGFTVVEATKHHERAEYEKARATFVTAREQADVQVPNQFSQYDVHDAGLTLGQYDRVLSARREGIESLREASAPEIAESARRAGFNEGLEGILQARAILTENSFAPVF